MNPLTALLAAVYAATLLGCASWSYDRKAWGQTCKDTDWEQLFYEAELRRGQEQNPAQDRLDVLAEACPHHAIKPDSEAKAEASARVQSEFCVVDRAYAWGRGGNFQAEVCSNEYKTEWRRGYRDFLVVQLEYLHKDGTFKSVYQRYLRGMNVKKKNISEYNLAKAEAESQAIKELQIQPAAPADEIERKALIEGYTKQLDGLRGLPH
jgi:hypothetical protein